MCILFSMPDLRQIALQREDPCACLLQTCIMAGCDFVKALPGIGIRKAHGHIRRLRSFVKVPCLLRTCVACQYNPPVAHRLVDGCLAAGASADRVL